MPYFIYEGRDKGGKLIKGESYAASEKEAIKILQQEEKIILSLKEKPAPKKARQPGLSKKVRSADLMHFANEMAILLENGVPIIDAFDIVLKQLESLPLRSAVESIRRDVETGLSFREAIAKHPKVFASFWQDMVEAGELSGQLPFVMRQIMRFLEFKDNITKKTMSALMYPSMLILASIVTISVFIIKIITTFEEMFAGLQVELPVATQILITISHTFRKYFIVIIVVIAAIVYFVKRSLARPEGRRFFETILLKIPVIGGFLVSLAIQKFTFTLSFLMKSGIVIAKALSVSTKAVGFEILAEQLEGAKAKVMGGLALSAALQETALFSPLAIQLVLVAEKTGNYSGMLEEIAKYYDETTNSFIGKFTTLLGPIILIIMGLVIGGMIIAMFLPMIKLTSMI